MKFRRTGTQLILNVTNPETLPLYENNEAYEVVAEEKKAVEPEKTTKATKKK